MNMKKKTLIIDEVSGCFGELWDICCAYKDDLWYSYLYEFGFYLGRFIYFIDAYEDIEDDLEKGTYNPLKELFQQTNLKKHACSFRDDDFRGSCSF